MFKKAIGLIFISSGSVLLAEGARHVSIPITLEVIIAIIIYGILGLSGISVGVVWNFPPDKYAK